MYLSHFNLKQNPFRISPDPKFLWLGQTHKEALSMLEYGIHDNCGFLLLSGDIGTGKTTLINGLLEKLDDQILIAMISDPGLEKLDFYNFLTQAFDIKKSFKSKGDFLVHFIHFLHKAHADNKKVLIIIDEAQRLSHELMEEIRQLSNIEKKDTKLLNIFLVGQHELLEALNETQNRALLQRITMKYLIGPLDHGDVASYIMFRLKVAGTEKKIFSSGAIRQIINFSNGYPRLINVICDHALLTTYVKGNHKVNDTVIKECAQDLHLSAETPKESQSSMGFIDRLVDAIRHPMQKPVFTILFYLGLLLLIVMPTGIILFRSGLVASSITAMLPGNMTQQLRIEPETTPLTQKKSDNKAISSLKQEQQNKSIANPDSTTQPVSETPGLETGVQKNEAPPTPVESVQSPAPFKEKNYTVQFPSDSNEFPPQAYSLLDDIVAIALQYPDLEILVTGYSDSVGAVSYNRQLSKFRATIVKIYLVGQGVESKRILVSGLGPDNPIASNETPAGRQLNRRVEIKLENNGSSPD